MIAVELRVVYIELLNATIGVNGPQMLLDSCARIVASNRRGKFGDACRTVASNRGPPAVP